MKLHFQSQELVLNTYIVGIDFFLVSVHSYGDCCIRGEFKIEKVFVLDSHGFIRQKEDFVG